MPHLFGETYVRSPQTLSAAVSAWWSEGSPVKTSRWPARGAASTPNGLDSSLISCDSFATWDQPTSFWRTSQQSLFEDSTPYSDRWPKAGSMRSGAVSKQPTLARLIAVTAGGCSRGTGRNWPTPAAMNPNDGEQPETWRTRAVLLKEKHHNGNGAGVPLAIAAQSPARQWQTPSVADTTGGHLSRSGARRGELLLRGQAKAWATPTVRDWKDGACADADVPTNGLLGRQAVRAVIGPDSHPDLTTETDGQPTSPSTPTSPLQLNERFVEALMGLRTGWTDCADSATPLCHSKPKPPCEHSGFAPLECGRE